MEDKTLQAFIASVPVASRSGRATYNLEKGTFSKRAKDILARHKDVANTLRLSANYNIPRYLAAAFKNADTRYVDALEKILTSIDISLIR